jgi:hypothetical protein
MFENKVGLGIAAILAVTSGGGLVTKSVGVQERNGQVNAGQTINVDDRPRLVMARRGVEELSYEQVGVIVSENQFGEGWDNEQADNLRRAGEYILTIFEQVYPNEKIIFDSIVIRPSTPKVIETLKKNWPDAFIGTDYSKMPFVVYPEVSEKAGVLPGIYYMASDFGDYKRINELIAHEVFHWLYKIYKHDASRFSPHGASLIVRKAMESGIIPGADYDPFLERIKEGTSCVCHKVVKGEALDMIVQRYGANIEIVMKVNGIKDPNNLEVGRRLAVPLDVDDMCGCFQVSK